MLKSWLIGTGFLIVLWGLYAFNILQWLSSKYAIVVGLALVAIVLGAALFILGAPFKNTKSKK